MPTIQVKRGTRAQINAAALANGLKIGEVYLITDEGRIAIGTGLNTYQEFAKLSEAGGGGSSGVNIQDFTTPGTSTWTKPANAKLVEVYIWSGGGGGGKGYSGTGSSAPGGGAGGSSGRYATHRFLASDLGATESVVVGDGGAGGATGTGSKGGASVFGSVMAIAGGGQGGGGNSASGATVNSTPDTFNTINSLYVPYIISRGLGGAGTSNAGGNNALSSAVAAGGGGGAGTSGSMITPFPGGNGGKSGGYAYNWVYAAEPNGSNNVYGGGGAGGTNGGSGANGADRIMGGDGGGGGSSVSSGQAGAGGDGGFPGGGGGGGGASFNGNGGNGGKGGRGRVRIITYF